MYEERKESFSIKGLIIQILFVVLFVFILLWLFPTKSYIKDYVKNSYKDELQPLYNQIYIQNMNSMKETAITYFTTDKLPSKVGDTVTISLGEMQNKKLILDLIDSNNNKCDIDKSYVKVVKQNKEYAMTVTLSCSDKEDYINVNLGCYNYCENGLCEKKVVETKSYIYEYEKITNGKWGNWSNWSNWSTEEVSKTDYKNVETKIEKVVTGTEKVQTGTKTTSLPAKATTTYSCEVGTLNGNKCIITTTTGGTTVDAKATTTYSCEVGTLNGNKCNVDAKATTTYSCPSGYTYISATGKCYGGSIDDSVQITTYVCPSGYIEENNKCVKYINATTTNTYTAWSYQGIYYFKNAQTTGVQSSGIRKYEIPTQQELKNAGYTNVISISSSCSSTDCVKAGYYYKVYTRTITKNTTCSVGTLSGSKCKIFGKYLEEVEYQCEKGSLTADKKCIITDTKQATTTTTYSCATGTLNGNKCIVDAKATTSYNCIVGTPNGNKCNINGTTTTKTVDAKATTTYSCATGTPNKNQCVISTPVYSERSIYGNVIYYRYQTREFISGNKTTKWSSSKTDKTLLNQGYSLTGNKKAK